MVRGLVTVIAGSLLALGPGALAVDDYVGGTPPEVQGVEFSRPAPVPVVLAQEEDPDDRIPITGGDMAGLTAIGLGSIAAGMALTRRARRRA